VIRKNRVASATCYLPLSDNLSISKELGTRHRAALGVSETTDSVTIIVSEETGRISVATGGKLERNLDGERMKELLKMILIRDREDESRLKKHGRRRKKA